MGRKINYWSCLIRFSLCNYLCSSFLEEKGEQLQSYITHRGNNPVTNSVAISWAEIAFGNWLMVYLLSATKLEKLKAEWAEFSESEKCNHLDLNVWFWFGFGYWGIKINRHKGQIGGIYLFIFKKNHWTAFCRAHKKRWSFVLLQSYVVIQSDTQPTVNQWPAMTDNGHKAIIR